MLGAGQRKVRMTERRQAVTTEASSRFTPLRQEGLRRRASKPGGVRSERFRWQVVARECAIDTR